MLAVCSRYRAGNTPHRSAPRNLSLLAFILLFASFFPANAHAQGCSQCRDNVAQSNPEVQRGYREAILLMLTASVALFSVTLLVIRKNR